MKFWPVYVCPRTSKLALPFPHRHGSDGLRLDGTESNVTTTSTRVPSGTTVSSLGNPGGTELWPVTGPAQYHVIVAASALVAPNCAVVRAAANRTSLGVCFMGGC